MSDEVKTEITAKNGVVTVLRTQQVDAILDLNRRALNNEPTMPNFRSRRRHVAEIPFIVAEQWFKEGINMLSADPDMEKAWQRKLNDPDYRRLRVTSGRTRVGRARSNYAPLNLLKLR